MNHTILEMACAYKIESRHFRLKYTQKEGRITDDVIFVSIVADLLERHSDECEELLEKILDMVIGYVFMSRMACDILFDDFIEMTVISNSSGWITEDEWILILGGNIEMLIGGWIVIKALYSHRKSPIYPGVPIFLTSHVHDVHSILRSINPLWKIKN